MIVDIVKHCLHYSTRERAKRDVNKRLRPPLFSHFLVGVPLPHLSLRRNFLGEVLGMRLKGGIGAKALWRKPLGMGDEIKFLVARSMVWGEKGCQYSEQKRRKDFKNGRRSEISWAEVK